MTSSPARVLIVDDRPANRYLVTHTLRRLGFDVLEASTGKEALELANQHPKVVILDVKLPDILGYEVCRRLKANPLTAHIPVLQLSAAFLSSESKVHALESGADAFLAQPVDSNLLIATVKSLIRLHDAEASTRLLGQQWQATFDALSEGVALIDMSGAVQRSNRAMTGFLGRSYSQIEAVSFQELMHHSFGIEIGATDFTPAREVERDSRYFRFSLAPVISQETLSGSILVLSEITDQKRAQAAIVVNERFVATGRMANTIAHEINNPLEAITNLLYLLNTSLSDQETSKKYLTSAQEELDRVSRIARQILSFNRESLVPVSILLPELLNDVLAFSNRDILKKNLKIRKEWPTNLRIDGYPAQLRQVFLNLLRNAVEASFENGQIRIRVSQISKWGPNLEPVVRVSIADNGVGISSAVLPRIYEAFYSTKELKGSGIGLWLSANIVQEHRGRITVRSCHASLNSGTCFTVVLPCIQDRT
ncbi:ATP-binding response regulator [Acidicapsa ligni]|uniref:ATP-binding response regulator n=1 Tax=Acidicapsa ligni TaxID=542300 RepID=UPI0021DFAD15|nr:ATP-binding protein [Acidicapsa ligni]